MLTIFNSFKAIHNPCRQCETRRDKQRYHNCMSFCNQSRSYLLSIGEIPHKPKQKNLSKTYPSPRKYHKLSEMCEPHQYQEASDKLHQIKTTLNISSAEISRLLNISVGIIRSMVRRAEKRTNIENIEKIMGYEI